MPTIITQVPPRRLAVDDRAAQGRGVGAGVRLQPDQHPRDGRGRSWPPASADLVSMARPLLADPDFVVKAAAGRADEINTCIACNQACLDHVFSNKHATCLVNPRAGRETDAGAAAAARAPARRTVAVVGAGPGRSGRRRVRGRARLRGHAVREVRRDRRPVPAGDGGARQGGLRRDAALLRAAGSRCSASTVRLGDRGDAGRPRGVRRRGRRDRRRAADARPGRDRPPDAWRRTPTCSAARVVPGAGSR